MRLTVVLLSMAFLLAGIIPASAGPSNGNNSEEQGPPEHAPAYGRERGMVYDGLRLAAQGTPCEGMWEIIKVRPTDPHGCTHGPDPSPEGVDISQATPPVTQQEAAAATPIVCEPGDDGVSGQRVHAMYAWEADETDRSATYMDSFITWAGNVEAAFADSAAKTGGERHVRWVHDGACNLTVTVVQVADGQLNDIGTMRSALIAQGFDDPDRKYHVWADNTNGCGVGYIWGDDRADPAVNYNNNAIGGASYSKTSAGCWGHTNSVEAHEIMHNIGGVQPSAPYATDGYHCVDNGDRMCYNDGALQPDQPVMLNLCPSDQERLFDCNDNDYFHTNPAPGSYLDTHWNTADSAWLFETAAQPGTPATPDGLTATAAGTDVIQLNWTDNANDETSYEVQRAPSGGTFALIAALGADATGHTDTGLTTATSYDYRVRAVNGNGPSGWSNQASATTDDVPPVAPTGFSATAAGEGQIDLSWTDASDNEDGFTIERSQGGAWSTIASPGAGSENYSDTGLAASTTYDYRIRAHNSAGESAWATASATTDSPPAFTDHFAQSESTTLGSRSGSFTATFSDDGSVETLTESESGGKKNRRTSQLQHEWTIVAPAGASNTLTVAASADASSDGDSFLFETNDGSGWQTAFTFDENSPASQSASLDPAGGTITLRVKDTDRGTGNRALDSIAVDLIRIRTDGGTISDPPATPTGVNAQADGLDIDVTWNDVADESGYTIERSLDGASWSTHANVAGDTTAFTDAGLTPETTYHYRVIASNSAGASAPSAAASATTGSAPPPPSDVHVGDLDGSSTSKKRWTATVDILIVDAGGTPVANADVSGSWSAGGSSSCLTDASGWCSVQKGGLRSSSVAFTVADVSAGAAAYDAGANTDPDGDSNGTTITIVR